MARIVEVALVEQLRYERMERKLLAQGELIAFLIKAMKTEELLEYRKRLRE